jgi:DNA-binding MurR/RpiR family transcriptional regulator
MKLYFDGDGMNIRPSISEVIRQKYPSFSSAQKRIADYLLEHASEVAFLSINRLAGQIGVSPSTVTRFAVEMGYSGYPELQEIVQSALRRRLQSDQAPPPLPDVYTASFACELQAIQEVRDLNPPALLDQAVELIAGASEIFVMGARASTSLAHYLAFQLNRALGRTTILTGDSPAMVEHRMRLGPGILMIAVSFPPYTRMTCETTVYARERGARVIVITDGPRSPLAGPADLLLQVPFDRESMFHSHAPALSLEHAIIAGVTARCPEQVKRRVTQIREEIARSGILMA